MKKAFALFLISVCVFISTGMTAFADCGPKSSIHVYVSGVENGREYYITLLTEGSYHEPYIKEELSRKDEVWKAIYEFSLSDEYCVYDPPWGEVPHLMTGNGSRSWGYMPPDKFKVLLYFPDDGSFLLSEIQERYTFISYYTAMIEN